MLAMVLAEKACGRDHVMNVGGGSRSATMSELSDHLAEHLTARIWSEVGPYLSRRLPVATTGAGCLEL